MDDLNIKKHQLTPPPQCPPPPPTQNNRKKNKKNKEEEEEEERETINKPTKEKRIGRVNNSSYFSRRCVRYAANTDFPKIESMCQTET